MQALHLGLDAIMRMPELQSWREDTELAVVTDCGAVLRCLRGHQPNVDADIWRGIYRKFQKLGMPVVGRHVKAHSGSLTGDAFFNSQCDSMAREARKLYEKGQPVPLFRKRG